jgi:hypothetical protein
MPTLPTICQTIVALLPVHGASIALMDEGAGQAVACSSGPAAKAAQDLEFVLGEGPAVQAFDDGSPVRLDEPDRLDSLWPHYSREVADLCIGAIYSFPLRVDHVRLGVLTLYRMAAGSIDEAAYADGLTMADLVTEFLLIAQSSATLDDLIGAPDEEDRRAVIHQATGAIAAHFGYGMNDALARLRARAFALDRPIDELADDVVTRSVRLIDAEPPIT